MMDCSPRRRSRNSSLTPIGWCSLPVTLPSADKPGAEALFGLARAFLLCGCAGATCVALGVNSDATVKLVTKAFDELKANPGLGRSEALRRSMLALAGTDGYAHPALWAPVVSLLTRIEPKSCVCDFR